MSLTRIYLPLNAVRLRELAESRLVGPPPLAAHGVTDGIRAASAVGLPAGERRRVVAAADVDEAWVAAADDGSVASAVTVSEPVPLQRIASFHVDESDVADDDELLWYDVTELTGLLDLF